MDNEIDSKYGIELLTAEAGWMAASWFDDLETATEYFEKAKNRNPPGKIRLVKLIAILISEYEPDQSDEP